MLVKYNVMKLLLLPVLLCSISLLCAESPVWEPERTWVFAVGVIKFDDPTTTSWPEKGRVDVEMIRVLEKRGVPADHILFLKNEQATKDNIVRKFNPFLKRAGPADTLIFYYAGHGSRDYMDPKRPCTFLTYDTGAKWTVSSIFDSVEKNFQGRQVIYTADCCHSGSLVVEAALHPRRAAALTSAHVASSSTGNWTFTNCLVKMFEGSPLLDLDGNKQITFAEAAHHVVNQMAFLEGQHSADGVSGGFPADTVMSMATGPRTPRMGELIEGESEGKWWKAKVLAEKKGQVLVTWPGWGKNYDEWLPLPRTRPYHPKTFAVGEVVQTEWQKKWYDATVLKVELGLHLVHYHGFSASDDEWVKLERLRIKQ
jgi:hypothetical protein